MEININFRLQDYEDADMPEGVTDPQELLLTPRELGHAIAEFYKALDAKTQLMDPVLRLPFHNDDSEDIFEVIREEMQDSRIIPYVELMGPADVVREQGLVTQGVKVVFATT